MALTAFPVGFFAGLFGIGGGLITVPFLFYIFEAIRNRSKLFNAFSCWNIFCNYNSNFNSISLTHNKFKAVDFDIVKTYGLFVIIGVLLEQHLQQWLKTKSLVFFFQLLFFFRNIFINKF